MLAALSSSLAQNGQGTGGSRGSALSLPSIRHGGETVFRNEELPREKLGVWGFPSAGTPMLLRAADEVGVGGEAAERGEELFDLDVRGHLHQAAAEGGDGFEFVLGDEEVFFAGAGGGEVDGGEEASLGDFAIEDEFHVAGAFELFEDDLIADGAGVDEAGGDDGE